MLTLPDKVPVAAESLDALREIAYPWPLDESIQSLVTVSDDTSDPVIVWASPKVRRYRLVWEKAVDLGFVEAADTWGDNVDIDHVFPKSWANRPGSKIEFVRLFPVWAEINRSAGAGLEKKILNNGVFPTVKSGIVFAEELQILKVLGHPVGTFDDPVQIFGVDSQ